MPDGLKGFAFLFDLCFKLVLISICSLRPTMADLYQDQSLPSVSLDLLGSHLGFHLLQEVVSLSIGQLELLLTTWA